MLEDNLNKIKSCGEENHGFDIIIISTANAQQENFWQKKLENLLGKELKGNSLVICITEDWTNGAGNGLGTLYTYQQARKKGLTLFEIDIFEKQQSGSSIAIYHTAGLGKRLAPLTLSEYNNKPGVKLPGYWDSDCKQQMSILEAVIKQTSMYGDILKGRLGVFWGDQIFIPSNGTNYPPTHHVEMLTISHPFPTQQEWKAQQLDNYGVLALDIAGNAKHLDKINYDILKDLADAHIISREKSIEVNLGSFSLSAPLLSALLEEFKEELAAKNGKMDSDPHFWMPLTLDQETYLKLMHKRGTTTEFAREHYYRMKSFLKEFLSKHGDQYFFGIVDIGAQSYWWDFGTIQTYMSNNLKLTEDSAEGAIIRQFYSISDDKITANGSIMIGCEIDVKDISKSVLIGVHADSLEVSNSLILNSTFNALKTNHCLLYNVSDNENLVLDKESVRADVDLGEEHQAIYTNLARDGKKDWALTLPPNVLSYEEISLFETL